MAQEGKIVKYLGMMTLALLINGALYFAVPFLQVALKPDGQKPKMEKVMERELVLPTPPPEKLVRREIQEIKPVSVNPMDRPTPARPASPGGGLKIDLSPAGGEGPALLSGGDRTGGIGSGTGGGLGSGTGPMTYEPGQTDSDARPIGPDPGLRYPPRAERENISGYVELVFVVNEFGNVENITVVKEDPPGYGFATSAIESARKLRFQPAQLQKLPVRQHFRRRFTFEQ